MSLVLSAPNVNSSTYLKWFICRRIRYYGIEYETHYYTLVVHFIMYFLRHWLYNVVILWPKNLYKKLIFLMHVFYVYFYYSFLNTEFISLRASLYFLSSGYFFKTQNIFCNVQTRSWIFLLFLLNTICVVMLWTLI